MKEEEISERLFGADDDVSEVETDLVQEVEAEQPEPIEPETPKEEAPPAVYGNAAQPEKQEAPAAPVVAPGTVPIQAMLDERDKRQKIERELDDLRRAAPKAEAPRAPDPIADPEAYQDHVQRQIALAEYRTNLRFSERDAVREFGADAVKAAKEWAIAREDADPAFKQAISLKEHPFEFAVIEHRRHLAIDGIDWSNPAEAVKALAARHNVALDAPPANQPQHVAPTIKPVSQSPLPPPSINGEAAAPASQPRASKAADEFEERVFGMALD